MRKKCRDNGRETIDINYKNDEEHIRSGKIERKSCENPCGQLSVGAGYDPDHGAGEILPGEISEVRLENHKDAPVSAAGDSARTGDDSPVMLYLASALLALLLATFALLLRRRLKQ